MEARTAYSVQLWKEGEQYVAHAMPLDVMSCGGTPEEARLAVDEAVALFLETARDEGTLDAVLAECGYELHGDAWKGPQWIGTEMRTFCMAA